MAARPREPRSLLCGPAAAAPGTAPWGRRGRDASERARWRRPGSPAGILCVPPGERGRGSLPLWEARSRAAAGAAPCPFRALPPGGEAGRAPLVLTRLFFFFGFPPWVTGPGSGSRFGGLRLVRSQAAREPPPRAGEKLRSPGPGRREKWARGEPCAGTHRGRNGASLTWRARRGRDNGASRRSRGPRLSVCAPGAVGVDMRVRRLSPAAPGGGPVTGNTASPRLPVEGTGAAPFQQVIIPSVR